MKIATNYIMRQREKGKCRRWHRNNKGIDKLHMHKFMHQWIKGA
jgi:hypothetical protein